jgi:hypothetical protein
MPMKIVLAVCSMIWFLVSSFLYYLGYKHLVSYYPLLQYGAGMNHGSEVADNGALITVLLVVLMALLIGYIKGRLVMAKVAGKNIARLHQFEKIRWYQIYPRSFYGIVLMMSGLSYVLNQLGASGLLRGFIDIAVATALGYGALCYFHAMGKARHG